MNKFLRYSFVALLAMFGLNTYAGDVTIAANSSTFLASGDDYVATQDGVTITYSKGNSTTAISGGIKDNQIRVYKNAILTISSSQTISKIVVTAVINNQIGADGFVAEGYAAADDKLTGTWTGSSNSVTLTASVGQVRITQVVVTVGGAAPTVAAPKFSVPAGTYYDPQTVKLTCDTEGAKILYTIPAGQDPVYVDDENYTGVFYDNTPLTITQTTTIKAMAVKDGQTSSIVSATYTIAEIDEVTVANALEIANALADGGYSDKEYRIKGYVVGTPAIDKKPDSEEFYGNAKFYMGDTKGAETTIYAYQIYGLNKEKMDREDYIKEGDLVVVQGKLQKYVKKNDAGEVIETTLEIAKGGFIVSIKSGDELPPLPELPTVEAQPVLKFTANGQWASYTFNKGDFYAKDYKGFRIEYSNMNTVESGAAFNILINSAETHLGKDWKGDDAQVPNKTAYKNWEFDSNHTVFVGDFSDFVVTDDPDTTCPTITQFALQACDAGNTVIIKKVVFIKQDDTEVLPEYKGDDWGGGAYTVEEVTDGITNVNADKAENTVRYNLAGQKVGNDFKGVVIMNGKKVVLK